MGLSLRNIGKKITDVFDANSAEDQRKRLAVGQPRYYADQQRLGPQPAYRATPQRQAQPSAIQNFATMVRQTVDPMKDSIAVNQIRLGAANLTNNDVAATNARAGIGRAYGTLKTNLQDPNYVAGIASPGGVGRLKPKVTPKTTGVAPKPVVQPVKPPPSVIERTDQIIRKVGIDPEQGLVKGNFFYKNPATKAYNKGQQKIIETIDAGRDKVAKGIRAAQADPNRVISGTARLPQVINKNFGVADKHREIFTTRTSHIEAAGKAARLARDNIEAKVKATGNPDKTYERVLRVFEDPDFLKRQYGDGTKLKRKDLTPAERQVYDEMVEFNKIRNDINRELGPENGGITQEQWEAYKDGTHSPRIADQVQFEGKGQPAGLIDKSAAKRRGDINQIDDSVEYLKNPVQGSIMRLEVALRNKANLEAMHALNDAGLLLNRAPNKNYVQLTSGPYKGKYIDKQMKSQLDNRDYYNSELGQKTGDLIDAYHGTILGKGDRAMKLVKTAGAPATNIGNIASNILVFSGAANVNPATMTVRMSQAGYQLAKHHKKFDPNVYRAEKAGLFSGDTGRQLVGVNQQELQAMTRKSKNPVKKIVSFYGNTDKAAALGLFNELKARGLSDAQAVRRVHKAVQNYGNSGRGTNALADTPIGGKPFVRFTPELIRIMKNNAVYNPLGTAAKLGAVAYGANKLSDMSGESPEERAARENAPGQTQLPGTSRINQLTSGGKNKGNVSLNLPIGDSAVNVARAAGLNFPIEPNTDPESSGKNALIRQLSPVADVTRTTADGKQVFAPAQTVSSLALRPIADQIANRDFMGRQITDPDNKIRSEIGKGKSEYENADGSRQGPGKRAELDNRLRHLKMNYVPLGPEGNAISNAKKGNPDYYGKERSLTEALLRGVGLKTESNTPEARKKRVGIKQFYEGKDAQVKEFLRSNPDKANDYFKFNDSSRDRFTNKKSSGLVRPEKWSILKAQSDDKLFNQLRREAQDASLKDGKPVDPIFQLNDPKRVKELIAIRATAPGDDIERQEILRATTNWFLPFEKAESKYYDDLDKYFDNQPKSGNPADKNDRVKAYGEIPYTEQTPLAKRYMEIRYGNEEKGIKPNEQAGKDFFKANADQLSADFAAYRSAKLKAINAKRAILGLDPISEDTFNNVTFGYEDDERKVARELYYKLGGGFGSGGKKAKTTGSAYKYAVSLNAGGAPPKPTVTTKAPPKPKARKKIAAPKVSLKKSKV